VQAEIRKVTLATKDILVDTVAQTIYASVPGSAGASGNSVVTLDPASGTTGTPVFVGSEPDILALSGDRHFLYVGLDGEAAVRRFDTTTQTAGLRVPLGSGEFGSPVYAEDIEVMPGVPGTIAVARRVPGIGGSHEGVVVYGDFEVSGNLLYHSSGRVVNTDTFAEVGQYQGMTTGSYFPARRRRGRAEQPRLLHHGQPSVIAQPERLRYRLGFREEHFYARG
jgi:hypothetical protein